MACSTKFLRSIGLLSSHFVCGADRQVCFDAQNHGLENVKVPSLFDPYAQRFSGFADQPAAERHANPIS